MDDPLESLRRAATEIDLNIRNQRETDKRNENESAKKSAKADLDIWVAAIRKAIVENKEEILLVQVGALNSGEYTPIMNGRNVPRFDHEKFFAHSKGFLETYAGELKYLLKAPFKVVYENSSVSTLDSLGHTRVLFKVRWIKEVWEQ